MNYLMLAIAIVAEVCATTAMKQSNGFTRMPWTFVTVIGYGIAFYLAMNCAGLQNVAMKTLAAILVLLPVATGVWLPMSPLPQK